jgi:hypothetical protein
MNATGEKLTTHGSSNITHKDPQTKALLVQGISSEGKPQKKKNSTSAMTHKDIPLKTRSQQGLRRIVPKRKPSLSRPERMGSAWGRHDQSSEKTGLGIDGGSRLKTKPFHADSLWASCWTRHPASPLSGNRIYQ